MVVAVHLGKVPSAQDRAQMNTQEAFFLVRKERMRPKVVAEVLEARWQFAWCVMTSVLTRARARITMKRARGMKGRHCHL